MRCIALYILLFVVSGTATAQFAPEETIVSTEKAKILRESVERLLDSIPAASVSFEGLFEECGLKVDCYTDYINSRIVLAPYRGVLQGSQGVFETSTGNSLEISLLLKQCLERVGYSVRIAKTRLSAEQFSTLALKISTKQFAAKVLQRDAVLQAFEPFAKISNVSLKVLEDRYEALSHSEAWRDSGIFKRAEYLSKELFGKLGKRLPDSIGKNVLKRIRENLMDYYFVQYRLEPGAPWKNFFYGLGESQELKIQSFFDGESTLHHTVTMQAFIKREENGRTEEKPVSDKMSFRTAELMGTDLYYMAAPDNIYDIVENAAAEEHLDRVRGFMPMMNSEPLTGALGFDLRGNIFPLSQLSLPVGALGGAVGDAGNKALETLKNALPGPDRSELPSSQEASGKTGRLLEHYLVIEWSEPGGEPKQYRRVLFDHARTPAPHPTISISQLFTLHTSYAPLQPATLLQAQLKRARTFLAGVEKANVHASTPLNKIYQLFAVPIRKTRDVRFDLITYLVDSVRKPQEQVVRFGPVLQAFWEVSPSDQLAESYLAIDVLQDEAVVLRRDETLRYDAAKTFEHGMWLSFAENIAVNGITADRSGFKDVVHSGVGLLEEYLKRTPEVEFKESSELRYEYPGTNAFSVLLNENTGMPLVLDEAGRGGSLTEHQIMLLKVGFAALKGVVKIALCLGDGSRAKNVACILCEGAAALFGIIDAGLGIGDTAGFMATEFGGDIACAALGRVMD